MGTLQHSVELRNARLDSVETIAGTAPILELRSGALPANCAAADAGTLLASITLPSDWAAAASGGSKAKSGTWEDLSADAAGTIVHFRLKKSDGVTCVQQGDVTATGGGGSMTVQNTSVAIGQAVRVTSYTLTDGNA